MSRMARCEIFDPDEVAVAHVYTRVCRRCFLLGDDSVSGKNFDHRKVWIEDYLRQFAACFGIDLLCFSILSNHFHLILRSRPDVVATWSDEEVARRWLMLCPQRRKSDGSPMTPTDPEIKSIAGCPIKRAEIRKRLSSFSWWMRLLCQRVATRANREDDQTGRFFQDRYHATRLADEPSLLACAAYVDLNPIRAAMAETLEQSDHTSVQRRIEGMDEEAGVASESGGDDGSDGGEAHDGQSRRSTVSGDQFLSPTFIDEQSDPVGPCESESGKRCSDKGFLAMPTEDYLELLDWTAREIAPGKRGCTPAGTPPILVRLSLDTATWCELVSDFGRLFCSVAGRPECVDSMRCHRTHRRYHLRRRARELLTATE